jgi:peptide/nickel transport system substrate-binding protein
VPTATDAAELAALRAGTLDVGYLPLSAVTATASTPRSTTQAAAGLTNYNLSPRYGWSTTYLVWNLRSTSGFGIPAKLLQQTYVRQALQLLVAQDAFVRRVYKGFAYPSSSSVPSTSSSYAARNVETAQRFAYDPARAISLLKGHGWTVRPGGTSICTSPGTGTSNCGAGIPQGAQLRLEIQYPSDVPLLGSLMNAQQAGWAQAGIQVTLRSAPSMAVRANAAPCVTGVSCDWQAAFLGGYRYQPGVYPLGAEWLATGAPFNLGSYSNAGLDAAFAAAVRPGGGLTTASQMITQNAPVLFEPTPVARLTEVTKGLTGVLPENVFGSLTPERWHRSG